MSFHQWRKSLLLDLPMDALRHDPTRGRTDNVGKSGGELHGYFGAGAATPTKLTDRHGYYFDGGDWIRCSTGYENDSGVLSMFAVFNVNQTGSNAAMLSWETVGGNIEGFLF